MDFGCIYSGTILKDGLCLKDRTKESFAEHTVFSDRPYIRNTSLCICGPFY